VKEKMKPKGAEWALEMIYQLARWDSFLTSPIISWVPKPQQTQFLKRFFSFLALEEHKHVFQAACFCSFNQRLLHFSFARHQGFKLGS
jgi:hypothetical protein